MKLYLVVGTHSGTGDNLDMVISANDDAEAVKCLRLSLPYRSGTIMHRNPPNRINRRDGAR